MATTDTNAYSLGNQSATATQSIACPKSVNPGPKAYALTGSGDCLLPVVRSGDNLVCDPDQVPVPGDLVAIWWKDGTHQPLLKRLVAALPPKQLWNMGGDARFIACVEMLNPPQTLNIPLFKVEAIHRVIHVIKQG
jgi:hypothetical protein